MTSSVLVHRIIFVFIVFSVAGLLAGLPPSPAFAQTHAENEATLERQRQEILYRQLQNSQSWIDGGGFAVSREKKVASLETSTNAIFSSGILSSLHAIMPVPGLTYRPTADASYIQQQYRNSALGNMTLAIAAVYANPPADLALWIRDTGQSLGFLPRQAYAQGVGFTGLAPLLPLWKIMRNVAYVLLAMVLIVVGFMVMLRKKIDPKTVVTVQNALPKIVVTLILITFSYAIVGLMVDIMYIVMVLAISLFKQAGLLPDLTGAWNLLVKGASDTPVLDKLFNIKTTEDLILRGGLLQNITNFDFNPTRLLFGTDFGVDGWVSGTVASVLAIVGGLAVGSVAGPPAGIAVGLLFASVPLLALIIAIAQLLLMIRLFFFFLGAYVNIIIALIFGPIQILAEAIPGVGGFSAWFKNLLANIAVFPIAAMMFLLAGAIIKLTSSNSANLWAPSYGALMFNTAASVGSWVALGILFAIPTVGAQFRELLKAKPLVAAGPETIGSIFTQPIGMIMQLVQMGMHHQTMEALKQKSPLSTGGGGGGGRPRGHP